MFEFPVEDTSTTVDAGLYRQQRRITKVAIGILVIVFETPAHAGGRKEQGSTEEKKLQRPKKTSALIPLVNAQSRQEQ